MIIKYTVYKRLSPPTLGLRRTWTRSNPNTTSACSLTRRDVWRTRSHLRARGDFVKSSLTWLCRTPFPLNVKSTLLLLRRIGVIRMDIGAVPSALTTALILFLPRANLFSFSIMEIHSWKVFLLYYYRYF